ncbi:MAG TPA: hypothetical protein VLD38_08665 [Nitrosopumilaceae archaeon]|nr:hypothetical protein [Nitrosopumilaceae archaeon]
MTKFEPKESDFICSACPNCEKLVWPQNDYCNRCFGEVIWRPISQVGKLIEFSKKGDVIFCIAEFENEIRIMGSLDCTTMPVIGQDLKLVKCSNNGNEEFVFKLNEV